MLNSIRRYLLVFFLLLIRQSHAQPHRQIIYPPFFAFLAEAPDQDKWTRPKFDDRDWQRLPFGSFPFENWRGQGWFRYGWEVDSARHEAPLGFSLTLRGAAEVWLDGQLQYRFGAIETAESREQPASLMFNTQNELLGEERAKELFQAAAEKSPQEMIAHLNRAGETWANGRTQQDDVTFVVIKIK